MEKLGIFLATHPLGGAIKAASGAVLVWALDNVSSFNLPPYIQVAVIAALPIVINYVNPMDERYGNMGEIKE